MEFSKWENALIVLIVTTVLTSGIAFVLKEKSYSFKEVSKTPEKILATNNQQNNANKTPLTSPPPPPPQKLSNPPTVIKSVYLTGYSAGSKTYLKYLSGLFKNTEINAVVVDIKGSDGYVNYASAAADVKKYNLDDDKISDIDALVKFFHDQNIYVIGRIAVFEDPVFAKARPNLAVYNKAETADLSQPVLWKNNDGI